MTNDVDIDLEDETIEQLIELYIRTNMCSASWEVYEREKSVMPIREAAGRALVNEAIINVLEIALRVDKLEIEEPDEN